MPRCAVAAQLPATGAPAGGAAGALGGSLALQAAAAGLVVLLAALWALVSARSALRFPWVPAVVLAGGLAACLGAPAAPPARLWPPEQPPDHQAHCGRQRRRLLFLTRLTSLHSTLEQQYRSLYPGLRVLFSTSLHRLCGRTTALMSGQPDSSRDSLGCRQGLAGSVEGSPGA
jgi:hypothetical protein